MNPNKVSPLRLEVPQLSADASLGEHLAGLARLSTPSAASRVRRSGWKLPLVTVATIATSTGLAYGTESAVSHHMHLLDSPRIVIPSGPSTPSPTGTPSTSTPSRPATTPGQHGAQKKPKKKPKHRAAHATGPLKSFGWSVHAAGAGAHHPDGSAGGPRSD